MPRFGSGTPTHPGLSSFPPATLLSFSSPSTKRAGNFVRKRQSCACMEIMELMMMRSMELEMGIDRERPA
jgi:hypothetical protein